MNYSFPVHPDWSTEEMVDVVEFLDLVERSYYHQVESDKLIQHYKRFKQVVPSKSEEKRISLTFERNSNCSVYRTIQKARADKGKKIKMT